MKIQYVVMEIGYGKDTEVNRFDAYEDAEDFVMEMPRDIMGSVDFYIRKVYTNRD